MSDYYVFCIIGFNWKFSYMKEGINFEAESNYYLILWSEDCGRGRSDWNLLEVRYGGDFSTLIIAWVESKVLNGSLKERNRSYYPLKYPINHCQALIFFGKLNVARMISIDSAKKWSPLHSKHHRTSCCVLSILL